jgi:hypothetical protein
VNFTDGDLGGAVLDLTGGEYVVSGPVIVPVGYHNYEIRGGVLRASSQFPLGATLLQIGTNEAVKGPTGQACTNVDVQHTTLDGSGRAGINLALLNCQYANVGPAMMIYGFTAQGIAMNGTGGGYIHHSWLGELSPTAARGNVTLTATAIDIAGASQHDCYVEDVIIYSAKIGIRTRNGGNQITGAHTWNLATDKGGMGILIENGSGKVVDSYLDFTPLVIVNPISMIVSNNLFLAKANLIVRMDPTQRTLEAKGAVQNLVVTSNRWNSEQKYQNETVVVQGKVTHVLDTVFESNSADSMWYNPAVA